MENDKGVAIGRLGLSVAVTLGLGTLAGYFNTPYITTTYPTLLKPGFTPPNQVFVWVWIVLYILLGVILFLLWQNFSKRDAQIAMALFAGQFVLNFAWCLAFFVAGDVFGGLIFAIALLAALVATGVWAWRVSPLISYLLIPVIGWVSFAVMLNWVINQMN